jgi:yecA family protein
MPRTDQTERMAACRLGKRGEDEPAFDSLDHLNRVLGLVMEHYNDVARTLIERPDRYGPRFAVDKRHNEVLWEIWVAGFEKALKLRPAAWQKLLTADHETAQAMSGLLTLADVDRRDSRFTPEQLDGLTAAAPHQIGPWVVTLNEWRLANYAPTQDFQTPRSPFSNVTIHVLADRVRNTRSAAASTSRCRLCLPAGAYPKFHLELTSRKSA